MGGLDVYPRTDAPTTSARTYTLIWEEPVKARVSHDMALLATHMGRFEGRKDVLEYLMQDLEDPDSRREFLIPASLPLKLQVCAALAALDGSNNASTLLAVARSAWPYDDAINNRRFLQIERLILDRK